MTSVTDINGTFDEAALSRLTFPIAWSGTVPAAARAEYSTAVAELVESARELIAECCDAESVDIVAGVVTGVNLADHSNAIS